MEGTLVRGWGWAGRMERIQKSNASSNNRLALAQCCCCDAKELGSAALPIVGLRLRQQSGGASGRRNRGQSTVKCIVQACQEEAVPRSSSPTRYNDSLLEVTAIEFLTNRVAFVSGKSTDLKGYDGFVDITRKLVHGLPSKKQRDTVRELLRVILPDWFLFCFQIVPKTVFVTEIYAQVTSIFFKWLVGDTEVREGEVNGVLRKSTVHIKKCRYLEQSQCVGLCVNLCKSPTQEFIGKQLGMPLTMNPNFEDMSCDMIYGLSPLPLEEDAAYQQPCYALCETAKARQNCA